MYPHGMSCSGSLFSHPPGNKLLSETFDTEREKHPNRDQETPTTTEAESPFIPGKTGTRVQCEEKRCSDYEDC